MDIWVPSSFWLLWMMMQWTFTYKHLLKILLSVLLGMYPEVELLDHRVILFLIFGGPAILFSMAAVPFCPSMYSAPRVPISPHPCQCLLFFAFVFVFIVAILMGVRCKTLLLRLINEAIECHLLFFHQSVPFKKSFFKGDDVLKLQASYVWLLRTVWVKCCSGSGNLDETFITTSSPQPLRIVEVVFEKSQLGLLSTVIFRSLHSLRASQVALVVKNPLPMQVDRDTGSILGSGRCPWGWHGNLFQHSCLENPKDREEPGGLQSMGSQRVRHGWSNSARTPKLQISRWVIPGLNTEDGDPSGPSGIVCLRKCVGEGAVQQERGKL